MPQFKTDSPDNRRVMRLTDSRAALVLKDPWAFALRTLRSFRAHQGMLLAGAVAYYALLSIVPLLILSVIALSHYVPQDALLRTLGRYLEWLMPGQSGAIVGELENFMAHREVIGWVLLASMLFFSSLAFTVLENAMSVIFHHRVAIRRRHFMVSALIPYAYILCLGIGLLLVTLVAGSLQAMGEREVQFLGREWSLDGASGALLYLMGFGGGYRSGGGVGIGMSAPIGGGGPAQTGYGTSAALTDVASGRLMWSARASASPSADVNQQLAQMAAQLMEGARQSGLFAR